MGDEELSCWASVTLTAWTFRQAKGDPWWLRQNLSAVQLKPGLEDFEHYFARV